MARTRVERKKPPCKSLPGDLNDPEGVPVWVKRYLEHLRVRNYSEATVHTTERGLRLFLGWAVDRGIARPSEITKPMIEAHQRWLFHYRKAGGKPLSFRTQRQRLQLIKGLFRWLTRENVLAWNPTAEMDMPRIEHRLPKSILSEQEVERVLAQPDLTDALGLRDRAMMELLYSCGLRRGELCRLALYDVDAERKTLTVRLGKGRKDRTIPIGERALFWLARYVDEVRPSLVLPPDDGLAFLTERGEGISLAHLSILMRGYIRQAKTGKDGAVHIFRHSMATHLLDAGADIRAIRSCSVTCSSRRRRSTRRSPSVACSSCTPCFILPPSSTLLATPPPTERCRRPPRPKDPRARCSSRWRSRTPTSSAISTTSDAR